MNENQAKKLHLQDREHREKPLLSTEECTVNNCKRSASKSKKTSPTSQGMTCALQRTGVPQSAQSAPGFTSVTTHRECSRNSKQQRFFTPGTNSADFAPKYDTSYKTRHLSEVDQSKTTERDSVTISTDKL